MSTSSGKQAYVTLLDQIALNRYARRQYERARFSETRERPHRLASCFCQIPGKKMVGSPALECARRGVPSYDH
jgi:hypothetical protein